MLNTTLPTSLNNLLKNKSNLNHIDVDQRKAAIETHESLVIANVPATIGRMAVVLHRIDYMTSSGIEYSNILVISPTPADVENISAANRFTGNLTVAQMISKINGNYPIRYKDIIINNVNDNDAEALSTIMQFISENGQSLFIVGNAEESVAVDQLIDSDVFTVYNL